MASGARVRRGRSAAGGASCSRTTSCGSIVLPGQGRGDPPVRRPPVGDRRPLQGPVGAPAAGRGAARGQRRRRSSCGTTRAAGRSFSRASTRRARTAAVRSRFTARWRRCRGSTRSLEATATRSPCGSGRGLAGRPFRARARAALRAGDRARDRGDGRQRFLGGARAFRLGAPLRGRRRRSSRPGCRLEIPAPHDRDVARALGAGHGAARAAAAGEPWPSAPCGRAARRSSRHPGAGAREPRRPLRDATSTPAGSRCRTRGSS